ncbi:MAG: esterase-like activity of phytase family protein [Roseobacter sp.]
MRRRFAIPIIAAIGVAPWLWFFPQPPAPDLPAKFLAVADIETDADWMGGFSGLEISPDGGGFHTLTDRGYIAQGELIRVNGMLSSIQIDHSQPLRDRFGKQQEYPFTDAEGLAIDAEGRIYVSFEGAHRVLIYDTWESPARWPSYTRAWRALSINQGLEALAVSPDGAIYSFPERVNTGATESLVYRKLPNGPWLQPFTLPVDREFAPVGADFGPDGLLYILERAIYPFGFYSRVRSMSVSPEGVDNIQTVLQTRLGKFGNLEGLSVWRDDTDMLRLTMVSDDNFYPFMRGRIVEYGIDQGVAMANQ